MEPLPLDDLHEPEYLFTDDEDEKNFLASQMSDLVPMDAAKGQIDSRGLDVVSVAQHTPNIGQCLDTDQGHARFDDCNARNVLPAANVEFQPRKTASLSPIPQGHIVRILRQGEGLSLPISSAVETGLEELSHPFMDVPSEEDGSGERTLIPPQQDTDPSVLPSSMDHTCYAHDTQLTKDKALDGTYTQSTNDPFCTKKSGLASTLERETNNRIHLNFQELGSRVEEVRNSSITPIKLNQIENTDFCFENDEPANTLIPVEKCHEDGAKGTSAIGNQAKNQNNRTADDGSFNEIGEEKWTGTEQVNQGILAPHYSPHSAPFFRYSSPSWNGATDDKPEDGNDNSENQSPLKVPIDLQSIEPLQVFRMISNRCLTVTEKGEAFLSFFSGPNEARNVDQKQMSDSYNILGQMNTIPTADIWSFVMCHQARSCEDNLYKFCSSEGEDGSELERHYEAGNGENARKSSFQRSNPANASLNCSLEGQVGVFKKNRLHPCKYKGCHSILKSKYALNIVRRLPFHSKSYHHSGNYVNQSFANFDTFVLFACLH